MSDRRTLRSSAPLSAPRRPDGLQGVADEAERALHMAIRRAVLGRTAPVWRLGH